MKLETLRMMIDAFKAGNGIASSFDREIFELVAPTYNLSDEVVGLVLCLITNDYICLSLTYITFDKVSQDFSIKDFPDSVEDRVVSRGTIEQWISERINDKVMIATSGSKQKSFDILVDKLEEIYAKATAPPPPQPKRGRGRPKKNESSRNN